MMPDPIVTLYNNACCVFVFVLYLAIGLGVISSRPAKRKKRGGIWTQNDSHGETQK